MEVLIDLGDIYGHPVEACNNLIHPSVLVFLYPFEDAICQQMSIAYNEKRIQKIAMYCKNLYKSCYFINEISTDKCLI